MQLARLPGHYVVQASTENLKADPGVMKADVSMDLHLSYRDLVEHLCITSKQAVLLITATHADR